MQRLIDNFINTLRNPEGNLNRLAGAELIRFISDDTSIYDAVDYIVYDDSLDLDDRYDEPLPSLGDVTDRGDRVVFDRRLCSGFYVSAHDIDAIYPIQHDALIKYALECVSPVITSDVSAHQLMWRYHWFVDLLSPSSKMTADPRYPTSWETVNEINASFEAERPGLSADPYLALYWLMHFGFSLDTRYQDVKVIIQDNQLGQQLDFIEDALAFFGHHPWDADIQIAARYTGGTGPDLTDAFLKRRAYLVWTTQSYSYASGPDGVEGWWRSVALYPKADTTMIRRMRWLGNNLQKFEKWHAFFELLEQYPDPGSVSLLSYVQAQNPASPIEERRRYANRFLGELLAGKDTWRNPTDRKFGQGMIWKIREQITDMSLLRATMDTYFAGERNEDYLQDLNAILTPVGRQKNSGSWKVFDWMFRPKGTSASLNSQEAPANMALTLEAAKRIHALGESVDEKGLSDAQRAQLFRSIDAELDKTYETSAQTLFDVIANLSQKAASHRALHYLYVNDIPNKKDALTELFIRLQLGKYDVKKVFKDIFPNMFKDARDPNLVWAQQMVLRAGSLFPNKRMAGKGREAAMNLFTASMHWDENLNFFLTLLQDEQLNEVDGLKHDVFTNLLSSYADDDPKNQMSDDQFETIFETVSEILRKQEWYRYDFMNEAMSVFETSNPKAKAWLTAHHNNDVWLSTFPYYINQHLDDVRSEINDSIGAGVDMIAEYEDH